MSSIDVETLVAPIEVEPPCGPSLDYDPDYLELERLAQGTPEQQMGDSVIAAQEPNWREVGERSLNLLRRSKDLKLIIQLSSAQLETDGLAGLRDSLAVLRETLERYWDQVHPQLDPEDDNDPVQRVNIIASLAQPPNSFGDPLQFVRRVREVPLTNSRQLGRFSLRDVAIANGELPAPAPDPEAGEGETSAVPDPAMISSAFDDTETDELVATADAADGAREELSRIDKFLMETVGAANAPDLGELERAVDEAVSVVRSHLSRRGVGEAAGAGDAGAGPRIAGEVRSREDVVLALDKVCRYYDANEPSSPVPLLIRRAQRLVAKSYVEIVKDLTPGAVSEIETIGGQGCTSSK